MKNFLAAGEIVTVPAPATVASGDFVVVGAFFGVAQADAASGADVSIVREGVFALPKTTGTAWTKGDPLYWDASAKKFTKTATGNVGYGVAAADAASGDATGNVSIEAVAPEGAGNPVGALAAGVKLLGGEIALDGSNPTPVVTGLATITGVALALKKNAAPGVGTSVVTYDTTGGTLNIYGWKPTSNSDPTLIASAGTETVGYVVTGT